MKKLFLLALLAGSVSLASAQKQEAGDKSLEVNFTPLGGSPISINYIKLRSFTSSNMAYRLGIGVSYAGDKTPNGLTTDGNTTMFDKEMTTNITLKPGFEKHWAGTTRLSPYWGAELDLGYQMHTLKNEYENPTQANSVETHTTKGTNGYMRIGANLVAGADYYISSKLYMGTEIGFGVQYRGMSKIKNEDTISGYTAPDDQKQGSSMNIGPNFNGAIRLGFLF